MKKILTTSLLLVTPLLYAGSSQESCLTNPNCTITEVISEVQTAIKSANLVPQIKQWDTSGDATTTVTDDDEYCENGEACTGYEGGTFSTKIDFSETMTVDQINAGFDLNYGVTVNSHESNLEVPLCENTNYDCKDSVSIEVVLTESGISIPGQNWTHEFVLDYADQYNYQFSQSIGENNYQQLAAMMSLYGIDAGWTAGMWGPQFLDPYLTLNYTSIEYITNEIYTIIENVIDNDITDISVDIIAQDIETNDYMLVDTISSREEEEAYAAILLEEQEAILLEEQEAEEERESTVLTLVSNDSDFQIEASPEEIFNEPPEISFGGGLEGPINFSDTTDSFSSAVLESAIDMPPPIDHNVGFDNPPELEMSMEMAPPDMGFSSFEEPMSEAPLDMPVDAPEMTPVEQVEIEVGPTEVAVTESPREAPVESESRAEPTVEEVKSEPLEAPKTEVAEVKSEEKPVEGKPQAKETKKERVARKVADRVMTTLAQTYNVTMQNVALNVMGRETSLKSYEQDLLELISWYPDKALDGGVIYDHPAQIYIQASANEDMNKMEALQWQK